MTRVCGVTLILASRSSYSSLVRVTQRINFLCIGVTAVAGVSLDTLALASGSGCNNTLVIIVTERANLVGYVAVATMTGICCITLVFTGRRGYSRLVVVTELVYFLRIRMTAVAGVSFNALVYTVGGSCDNALVIAVTESINLFSI